MNDLRRFLSTYESIGKRDIKCENLMMKMYKNNNEYWNGIKIFDNMDPFLRNNTSYIIGIEMYSKLNNIDGCEKIYRMNRNKNSFVLNGMMHAYNEHKMYDKTVDLFLCDETEKLKDNVSCNIAIKAYSKLNDIHNFEKLFNIMNNKDVSTYNSIMQAYNDHKMYNKAIQVFNLDEMKEIKNDISCNIAIQAYSKLKDIPNCEKIFENIDGKNSHIIGGMMQAYNDNEMYSKCIELFESGEMISFRNNNIYSIAINGYSSMNNIEDCEKIFNRINSPNIIVCNCMMRAYRDNKMYQKAINVYNENKWRADNVSHNIAIESYSKLKDIHSCEQIFNRINIKNGMLYGCMMQAYNENGMHNKSTEIFESSEMDHYKDNIVSNIAINSYSKLGNINKCRNIFENIKDKDEFTFNSMLQAYKDNHMYHECLKLFSIQSIKNNISFSIIMEVYSKLNDINKCEGIFKRIKGKNSVIYGGMMQAYNDHKLYTKTIELYMSSEMNSMKNNIIFGIAIQAYSQLNDIDKCEKIFESIINKNTDVYNTIMQAYNDHKMYHKSIELFLSNEMVKLKDNISCNIAIQAYSKLNEIDKCETVFESIQDKIVDNYACMMQAYNDHSMYSKSIELFELNKMKLTDNVTASICIQAYAKLNDMDKCDQIFHHIRNKNLVSYSVLINSYRINNFQTKALDVFNQLWEHSKSLNSSIFCNAIYCCVDMGSLNDGRTVLNKLNDKYNRHLLTEAHVLGGIISLHGKCISDTNETRKIYDIITHVFQGDNINVIHASMLDVYTKYNDTISLLLLFNKLRSSKVKLTDSIYSIALNCCSHTGYIDDAIEIFNEYLDNNNNTITDAHILTPIIDCLSRNNQLNDAEYYYHKYSHDIKYYKDKISILTCILSSCKIHNDINRAQKIVNMITDLHNQNKQIISIHIFI